MRDQPTENRTAVCRCGGWLTEVQRGRSTFWRHDWYGRGGLANAAHDTQPYRIFDTEPDQQETMPA